jgi:hypothetical protein
MKATYKTLNGKLLLEFEAQTTEDLVENLANIQEVCEQEKCTHCEGTDFKYIYRTVDGSKYHELKCKNCHWKLGFSITKKGSRNLYARRSNFKTKQPIGPKKDGWHYFEVDKNDNEEE